MSASLAWRPRAEPNSAAGISALSMNLVECIDEVVVGALIGLPFDATGSAAQSVMASARRWFPGEQTNSSVIH